MTSHLAIQANIILFLNFFAFTSTFTICSSNPRGALAPKNRSVANGVSRVVYGCFKEVHDCCFEGVQGCLF